MNKNYVLKLGKTTMIDLINHLVLIDEDDKNTIAICSSEDSRRNVIFSRSELLEISKKKMSFISIRNNNIYIGNDWILFVKNNTVLLIYKDMFNRIIDYILEDKGDNQ